MLRWVPPPRPFHRITTAPREPAVFPDLARDLNVMALNLLWAASLTYINLIHRHRPG